MAVHHAVGIRCQRNSGYRPSRVNIVAQCLSTPYAYLSPTHITIRRGHATTTHYTHHQVSLMVSSNTTLLPSLGLRIGPACETGLSAGMRRERVSPQIRKKERKKDAHATNNHAIFCEKCQAPIGLSCRQTDNIVDIQLCCAILMYMKLKTFLFSACSYY